MTKKEIIYDNLLRLLKFITSGNRFDDYYNHLIDEQQSILLRFSEDVEVEIEKIEENRNNNLISFSFENLLPLLTTFSNTFSDYAEHRLTEMFLLIELLSRLNEAIDDAINIEDELEIENFSFVLLLRPIHSKNYIYYDANDFLNSICLLNIEDISSIHDYLEINPQPLELILQLLAKIGNEPVTLQNGKYVLVRRELENQGASIWACLAMHIIKAGEIVHTPYPYELAPQISNRRLIISGKEYQQFKDSLIILSEYNEQKDILDKYLRLYHVVENFMYKFPLVKLERLYNGSVFSIRDFQRMYDKIKTSEITALTKLFKRICDEEYDAGQSFGNFVVGKWQSLSPAVILTSSAIDSLLSSLRINKKKNDEDVAIKFTDFNINNQNTAKLFSAIVYGFRNSLVHNRETEFHLTYETILNHPDIGDCAKNIIEHFLIPVLEEMVFFLITKENDIVWFQNPNLVLFERN